MKTGSKYYGFNNGNEHGVKFFKEETPENMDAETNTYILREASENWFNWFRGSNEATCSMDLASCKQLPTFNNTLLPCTKVWVDPVKHHRKIHKYEY